MSGRPNSFTITAAGQKVKLDSSGTAQASFTVTNTSAQALRGRLLTRPSDPAKPEWFSIVGESVRDFAPNASERVVVQLDVPPGSPPASYSSRLDAVSEVDPDEDFTEGPSVAFEVTAPPPPKKKFPWWILAIVGAVVLLIIIGVVVWLLVRDSGTATVPAVVGQTAPVAQNALTSAGFTVKTQSVPVTDPTQNGLVQSQDPAANTDQPKQTDVTITVGHMSLVPPVKGLTEAKAKTDLADADLQAVVREVGVADLRQNGIVQSQDPSAGTLQRPGTAVTIVVGRQVPVPNVVGRTQQVAEATITRAGLRPVVIRVPTAVFRDAGLVQSQDPPARTGRAETRVPLGSVVVIRVNFFVQIG
jgi:beta-lactam-binding protein with PASTA domain